MFKLLLFSIASALAAEPTLNDFASAVEVTFAEGGPAYRLSLPPTVYGGSVHSDLRDLRLFNSHGDSVPFELVKQTELHLPSQTGVVYQQMPFTKVLLTEPGAASQAVKLETDEAGKINGLKIENSQPSEKPNATAFVIDMRGVEQSVATLKFDWVSPDAALKRIIPLKIETSSDLINWSHVTDGVLVSAPELTQKTVTLPSALSKTAIRVTILAPESEVEVKEIQGAAPIRQLNLSETAAKNVAGTAANNELTYDMKGAFPITALQLLVPTGSAATLALSSSDKLEGPYTPRANATVFNFELANISKRSNQIEVPEVRDRFWKVQFRGSASQFMAAPPEMEIQWRPEQIVFLKNGDSPYLLAFGAAAMPARVTDPSLHQQMLAHFSSPQTGVAIASEIRELGGPAKLQVEKPAAWRSWVLPGILALAVLMIAHQAWRLLREMKSEPK